MAKIDKIQVGTTSYDINLPTTATPSITSLTVTGNLTVSGTSNLSVVSCISLSCSQINSLSLDDVLEINAYTVECSNSFYAVNSSFDSIDVGGGAFVAAGDSFDVSTDINIKNSENKSY